MPNSQSRNYAFFTDISPELKKQIREAFDSKYKPGNRRLMKLFNLDWSKKICTEPPREQTVRNFLDNSPKLCEYWLIDGLCQLLFDSPFETWNNSTIQSKITEKILNCQELKDEDLSSPYKGLSTFQEKDEKFFKGREKFVERLLNSVKTKSLVAVIGPSGSGKSSVVLAGLIPLLRREGNLLIECFRPKRNPFRGVASAFIRFIEPDESKARQDRDADELCILLQEGRQNISTQIERLIEDNIECQGVLLFIDQFEELYTLCSREERHQFLEQINKAIQLAQQRTIHFSLVITLRVDFLEPVLSECIPFSESFQEAVPEFLTSMTPGELKRSIQEPAKQLSIAIEEGLTERILNDLGSQSGNLPLLEFTLAQLWKEKKNNTLTHSVYAKIGGVQEALARHADKVYDKLDDNQKKKARFILTQLVHFNNETKHTRRLATIAEIGEQNWEIVSELASSKARLVIIDRNETTGEQTVELVHEALIDKWKCLKDWIEDAQDFRIWQQRLRVARKHWELNNKDEGELLANKFLSDSVDWLEKHSDEISDKEKIFIKISKEREDKDKQRLQELYEQAENARKIEEIAQVRTLTLLAQALLFSNDLLGALIASTKAIKRLQRIEATSEIKISTLYMMQQILSRIREINRLQQHTNWVMTVAFNPNGNVIASGSADRTVKLWNLDGSLIRSLTGHTDWILGINFSPDGKLIASASDDETIKLWSLDGEEIQTLLGHQGWVLDVTFSPDGKKLASAGSDNIVFLWDTNTFDKINFQGHTDRVRSVCFSPDGQTLASASEDKTVRLWNLDGSQQQILQGHTDRVRSVCFSPDGKTLASASDDCTIILWSLDGSQQQILQGHTDRVRSVCFSPDGQTLASASDDKTVRLWQCDGIKLQAFQGHTGRVRSVCFSPDGQTLASASEDKTVRLWSLKPSKKYIPQGHTDRVRSVCFSPNGQTLASASDDGTVIIWSLGGTETQVFQGHKSRVLSIELTWDGQILASASEDKTIVIWSIDGKKIQTIKNQSGRILDISFHPSGQIIVSANDDGTVIIWQLDSNNSIVIDGHNQKVRSVSFHPSGQMFASASDDGTVKIWQLDGTCIRRFDKHTGSVRAVCFSPDGQMIASAGIDNTVKIWNIEGVELHSFKNHTDRVLSISFSPSGKLIASAGADSVVRLWTINGSQIGVFSGHKDWIWSVRFSPDGETIASGSSDKTIKLWSLEGQEVKQLLGSEITDFRDVLAPAYDWLHDYLRTNPNIDSEDSNLCCESD